MKLQKSIIAVAATALIGLASSANTFAKDEKSSESQQSQELSQSLKPDSRLGEDWWKDRWEAKNKEADNAKDTQLVFLGDSITQAWEGDGKSAWEKHFKDYKPLNWGYSGDRTEHLIWRLQNGDIQRVNPKATVILIGTNNTGHNQRPAAETFAGIKKVLDELEQKWPDTKVVLMSIFPRGATTEDPLRVLNSDINEMLAQLADGERVHLLDINGKYLDAEGNLSKEIFPDLLHLAPAAYDIWAEAVAEKLKELGL